MVNRYHCTLDPDLHECPHLVLEKLACTKGRYCCFRQTTEELRPKREPKWFEKYYRNYR